ncbi:MAG: radical SAM protein [Candidatus Thermoplasmatota archaeon]|nr:radical SAM protein [Candidatus Thermoplasmatota archaeon]
MDILFVNPWFAKSGKLSLFNTLFSSGNDLICQTLAAVTPKNHTIKMVDEAIEKINFDLDIDLVAITTFTRTAPRAYEIADEFRKRGKKVVLGGWHVTALPEEAKQHADSVVIGEAEDLFPQLLKDLEKNELKPFYVQEKPVDLDKIPILTEKERMLYKSSYFSQSIQISKGCPVGCNFCAISNMKFGNIHRTRSIENVIKEMKTIPEKIISFADPSLTINPNYTKQLFKEMKGLNKIFACEGNANVLGRDDELLKLAAEAGCISWYVGFESINQETIDSIGKSTNKVENYKKVIKKIHDYGMRIEAAFMFGFDTDKPDIFQKTKDTIQNWELDLIDFSTLTPYPGTPLFKQLEKENRILTREWEKYDSFQVVFKPKQMTPEELANGVQKMWEDFYSPQKALSRTIMGSKLGFKPFAFSCLRSYFYYKISKNKKMDINNN